MLRVCLVALTLALAGCSSDPVVVEFMDSTNGVFRFSVENRSERDVRTAVFIITQRNAEGQSVKVDTITHRGTRGPGGDMPFVSAGEETFLPTAVATNATTATATVHELEYWDGSVWPER